MRPVELGLVLPALEDPPTGAKPSWAEIAGIAARAEEVGVDTVWIPDELYWKHPDWPGPRGFWECVALTGAIAASTSTVNVGTWVLSALHRNAGLTAKVAETLDEISRGRFIFGLGAGHSGSQGKSFGFPEDKTVGRYAEALEVIVPLLRGENVTQQGEFHSAFELANKPQGPRPGRIPLMLAGHGPRTIGLAVAHADVWSAFATDSSLPLAFQDRFDLVDQKCKEQERDPGTLGRSVGVWIETPGSPVKAEDVGLGIPLRGEPEAVADSIREFAAMGATMVEATPFPSAAAGIEFLTEVLVALDA